MRYLRHFQPYEPTRAEIGRAKVHQFGTPWMSRYLTVLNPEFALADLTPRAMARVMIAESRKRERRSA